MTTDIATMTDLDSQWRYAQALTTVNDPKQAGQSLLPASYRGNPANVLIAIGLGQALGIAPAQALYEIYVVNGRPSLSANLMAALVRRAGHKLRIKGDATTCTATLTRSDDPDAPFTATWTLEQARAAGLTGKDTWKNYPAAMLRSRAVADVCRAGASEAILGMEYTTDELRDMPTIVGEVVESPEPRATAEMFTQPEPAPVADVTNAEIVPDDDDDDWDSDKKITGKQRGALFGAFDRGGFDTDPKSPEGRTARLSYISNAIGRTVTSTNDLSRREAGVVLDMLAADAAKGQP